tara:strand:+ start:744 stop:1157 length:414 start_codon:yes stop_codon:yes gene_type:complete
MTNVISGLCCEAATAKGGMPIVKNGAEFLPNGFMLPITEIGMQIVDGADSGGKWTALVVAIPILAEAELVEWEAKNGNTTSKRVYANYMARINKDMADKLGVHPDTDIKLDMSCWGPKQTGAACPAQTVKALPIPTS